MATYYFDPRTAPDLHAIKAGPNHATIGRSLVCVAATGGKYLEVEVQIDNMRIKDRITVENVKPIAVKMGLAKLKKLYVACGVGACDVENLTGRRVIVVLEQRTNDNTMKKYFEIVDYLPHQLAQANGQPATAPHQANQQAKKPPSRSEAVPNSAHPYAPGNEDFF